MSSMHILLNEEYDTLSTSCRIPKLHTHPYWEKYIAGPSTFSTKQLYINMINILSAAKYIQVIDSTNGCFGIILIFAYILENFICSKYLHLYFENHSSWKYINLFKDIIYNAYILKMASNVRRLKLFLTNYHISFCQKKTKKKHNVIHRKLDLRWVLYR